MEKIVLDLVIQKYGGSSVATVSQIEAIAQHIRRTQNQNRHVAVVISAMGGHTDELLSQAHSISSSPPRREIDMLLTAGERISMALLAIALDKIGVESISLTGSQCGIITDDTHGNARIKSILGDRIWQGLRDNKVVIVAGFQGVSSASKEVTTLGRGGTDLTAIALAATLKAAKCQLYKDVPGIFTADPRVVPRANPLKQINWQTMSELAWAGAGVLHHRSAHLAEKYEIAIEIRHTANPEILGTIINGNEVSMETPSTTAIAHKTDQSFVVLKVRANQPSAVLLTKILEFLWSLGESPSVSREQVYEDGSNRMVRIELLGARSSLSQLGRFFDSNTQFTLAETTVKDDLCSINVVGSGFRQHPEIVSKACEALPEAVPVLEIHNKSICMAVLSIDFEETLKKLHELLITKLA